MPDEPRKDTTLGRRILSVMAVSAAVLVAFAGIVATTLGRPANGQRVDLPSVIGCVVCFALPLVVGNVLFLFYTVAWRYRCPQCRQRAERLPGREPGDKILYRCGYCRVVWDTGWHVADSSD